MAKKTKHNPERRAFKGKSYKKGRERISALRLRDFVREIQEAMAICEFDGWTQYLHESIEAAFEKHKIPTLEAIDDPDGDDAMGISYKGATIVPTIRNLDGEFEDIDDD